MKKKVWLPTIIMFFFGVLFLMPIILLVMNAFKTHNDMIQNFLSFPHYLYTGNFTEAIERLKFWRVVGNSAYVTLGTMLVCTIISFMAAYGIAHIPGKLGNVLYLLFTLGQIIPFHSIMIALSVQLTNANLLNNLTVLIFLYAGFHGAFGIFTYVGFLKSIPKELEEVLLNDAKKAGVNVSEIIIRILKKNYKTKNSETLDYIALKDIVFKEIEEYISTLNINDEFELYDASETFRNIPMTKEGKPNVNRAKLGRLFGQSIGKKPFENVERVYIANGNVKKSRYNKATMFKRTK